MLELPFVSRKLLPFRFALLIFGLALLLLPLLPPVSTSANWVYFLGRFHPLIIHFPIVLLSLLLLLELINLSGWPVMPTALQWIILSLAGLGSLVAVSLGYLLYSTGDYQGEIAEAHLWLGIGVVVGTLLMLFFRLNALVDKSGISLRMYHILLLLTNGVLIVASHQGGSLTHGTDYLTDYMPHWESVPDKSEEEMLVYNDVIVPMLDAKCYSCHNEYKKKGELLLTNLAGVLEGGESGQPGLVPGDAEKSEIWKRVTLPFSHDDFMPPEGKPALTDTEVNVLQWWINAGADQGLDYLTALGDSSIAAQLQSYASELRTSQIRQWKADKALTDLVQQVTYPAAPFLIERHEENSQQLILRMPFPPGSFGDQDLIGLRPLFGQFVEVSLVSSDISDDGLFHLGQMEQLQELSLQKTNIQGAGLVYLTELPLLKILDLSHTKVDDASLLYVTRMPRLTDLYIYETSTSINVIETLRAHLPDLNIHLTRSPNL